jgi:hypothetical protein
MNSDEQNARIEHDEALLRVMTTLLDTELFEQFSDNESFRRWLTDSVFDVTCSEGHPLDAQPTPISASTIASTTPRARAAERR